MKKSISYFLIALCILCLQVSAKPPIPTPPYIPGYVLVQLENNTTQPDAKVYILIKGLNAEGRHCFLKVSDGIGDAVAVNSTTLSKTYSYPLSALPEADGHRYLYIPNPFTSGRIYFSIDYPLLMAIVPDAATGALTIVDPPIFSLHDPNYYTLYDKIEFSYTKPNANANLYVNPTAVDFFSLPINIHMFNPTPNSLIDSGLNRTRNTVFTRLKTLFSEQDLTHHHVWNKLFLQFYKDPYATNPVSLTDIRIVSPSKATAPGSETVNPPHAFPNDYLSNPAEYGFNYINNVWNFYKTSGNQLRIDAKEIAGSFGPGPKSPLYPSYYHFTGKINDHDEFVFTNGLPSPNTYTWKMSKPTQAYPFFAGAEFIDSGEANNTPGAIIVREMTSAFEVGFLPRSFPVGTFLDHKYFVNNKSHYFTPNAEWGSAGANNGPFYNLYSKALHSFGDPIYTFAYDDLLGQDGTLTGNVETLQSSILLTLQTIDTKVPNPFEDDTRYTIEFHTAANNPVQYRSGTHGTWLNLPSSHKLTDIVSNSEIPFQIRLKNFKNNDEVLTVYLKYNIVIPEVSDFALSNSIVILHTSPAPESHVTIKTPALTK